MKAKRNPWAPRPSLEPNPWSLFPVIGLTKSRAWIAQVLWATFACIFLWRRTAESVSIAIAWLVGVWAILYITQRLGGREATLSAGVHVTPESPFLMRLFGDLVILLSVIFLAAIITFGVETVRAFGKDS